MKAVDIEDATGTLAQYTQRVAEEPVVVTDHGRPVAALVAVDEIDLEDLSLSTNPDFIALIERSRARQEREGGISSQEMRRRLGLS